MAASFDISNALSSIGDAQSAQSQAALKFKDRAKAAAENFESTFINSMFQQMFTDVDGDGPFGGSGALKVWRSFMTDQYAKMFAKNGGVGIASHVYDELLKLQAAKTGATASAS